MDGSQGFCYENAINPHHPDDEDDDGGNDENTDGDEEAALQGGVVRQLTDPPEDVGELSDGLQHSAVSFVSLFLPRLFNSFLQLLQDLGVF